MNYNLAESMFSTTVLSDQLYSNIQNNHISSFKSGAIIWKNSRWYFCKVYDGKDGASGSHSRTPEVKFFQPYCRNSEVLKGGIADFEVGLRI